MIRSRERPVAILQDSLKSVLIIIFISYGSLRLFKTVFHERGTVIIFISCATSHTSCISHIRKSVLTGKRQFDAMKKILDWEFEDLSRDPSSSIKSLHIQHQVHLSVCSH